MERSRACLKPWILLHLISLSVFFIHSDARRMTPQSKGAAIPKIPALISTKRIRVTRHLDSPSNTQPYVSSPFTLPPYDSLPPIPLPDLSPPYCIYPPLTPQPPASTTNPPPTVTIPSPPPYVYIPPTLPFPSPPPSPTVVIPGPPESFPSPVPVIFPTPPGPGTGPSLTPPTINPPYSVPSPSISIPSPPSYVPSPGGGGIVPSPPSYVPSPGGGGIVPSPTIFLPPIVYPPPAVPPPPNTGPSLALWCVAKPSVPEPIIQEAMNYACGSGADCASIEPQGSCFQPNTLFAHASYAFNSYWQRTKVAGGSCSFGGTAMLVTVDPSYDGCHFLYL